MSLAEDLADKLAARVIAHVQATGDEDLVAVVSSTLGDSSQTLQEAFVTSVRVQRAALRADALVDRRIAEHAGRTARPGG